MHRVLLKISGERLAGDGSSVHDAAIIGMLAEGVKRVHDTGIQVCLVVGGGNIYRGSSGIPNIERATSDYMGMLATVINALALQGAISNLGIVSRVQSAIPMRSICEPYTRQKAISHMEKNRVVIFAAGTGNPFFTTDTAAVLRAVEMNCDVMLKGTLVDGVYSDDPKKNSNAERISRLSYTDVLSRKLRVLDSSAVSVARENSMPIIIFALDSEEAFYEVVNGRRNYSIIEGE
ncbi:UMP kinase [Neorickettsia helminthoeca str. Oregon]|uniref:Uridylate kinase n=1 Tax=Neorickettsia helminthoeca str. Oregon TaxID=1286528 RepID=X5GXN6_9RICK|nr:UMP kinase [Neorickettsia helminthoeca]AHX11822.1 UMP kinase [Neorickettsia helminthoeca str. Oregon]